MRSEQGFTYLWVLALVAMIGAGYVVVAEVYATAQKRDREQALLFIGHEFRTALERYYGAQIVGGVHEYPARLEQLLRDDRFPDIRRHLRRLYVDPMTGKDEWGVVRVGGRIVGVHSLSEVRPLKQKNFEPDDSLFEGRERYSEWVFAYPPAPPTVPASPPKPGAKP
jgi:type II secretory pathway pseudopilin PulG